eukprot:TRINITY_DN9160_c0_g2_i1.p1 TRINITY_DN9160_c0_g2~~TRINITY_DN9160_c0_g2_i1.p1  ORF type:complete len:323 (+),score=30.55 TRINITY_DN9160_c0_g2_i1:139-1107(+)
MNDSTTQFARASRRPQEYELARFKHDERQISAASQLHRESFASLRLRPAKVPVQNDLVASVVTGTILAGAFNPWDRALYLSVKDDRPFLSRSNFVRPYEGFRQAMAQRIVSGGLYFFLQGLAQDTLQPAMQRHGYSAGDQAMAVGLSAGFANGIMLNQLATVKYYTWNKSGRNLSFLSACARMYQQAGIRPFLRGMMATGARDMVFGLTYEWIRSRYRDKLSTSALFVNMTAGAAATVVSGPLNYVRNMQYAASLKQPCPSTWAILSHLFGNARAQSTWMGTLQYLQFRLRIGWGSLRVAVGMSAGQALFDWSRTLMTVSNV